MYMPLNEQQYAIGTFAIIFDSEKRVLLCHRRDYDLWNLPGGKLEQGESPWDGVIREVKEETGLDVHVDRLAGIYHKPEKNEIVFSFVCSVTSGGLMVNDEADKMEYFVPDSLPKNTSPKQVERIQDAIAYDTCVMKTQSGPSSIELIKQGKL